MSSTEPEKSKECRKRKLKELEGKNIAQYSVMLSAYINSDTEINKAILAFSSAAIGLLIATYGNIGEIIFINKIFLSLAVILFFVAIISTLFVFLSNRNYIEAEIRAEREQTTQKFKTLNTYKYINYISFGCGVVFTGLLSICSFWL